MTTVIERVKKNAEIAAEGHAKYGHAGESVATILEADLRALIELAESYQCGHDYHADDDSGDNCRLCNASRAVFEEQEPKP